MSAAPTRVLLVCLGNICRSPMADALLRHKVTERGLDGRFEVDSAGTGSWHVGEAPDPRTQAVLRAHGVPVVGTARTVQAEDFVRFDHILGMDAHNVRTLRDRCPPEYADRIAHALSLTGGGDVPDPYYDDDGFEHVYALLDEALDAWLERWTR